MTLHHQAPMGPLNPAPTLPFPVHPPCWPLKTSGLLPDTFPLAASSTQDTLPPDSVVALSHFTQHLLKCDHLTEASPDPSV